MYFVNTVPAVICCVIIIYSVFTNGQRYGALQDDKSNEDNITSEDQNSFVALIDILFTDGSKRTCTGTIIHDNVIITAAHCFYSKSNKNARAELTASFVVIGNKHLFETGYEQYFPIERVVTHPKFQDWTADIALVYTFAGMTSDKPGNVIPLAGERTSTPVDSNVTVISWGHLTENKDTYQGITKMKKINSNGPCSDSASQEKTVEITKHSTSGATLRAKPISEEDNKPASLVTARKLKWFESNHKRIQIKTPRYLFLREEILPQKSPGKFPTDLNVYKQQAQPDFVVKMDSKKTEQKHYYNVQKVEMGSTKTITINKVKPMLRTSRNRKLKKVLEPNWSRSSKEDELDAYNIKSYYKNWRRQMGTQQNKLNVETFGFVDTHTCKRVLENAVPDKFLLKRTDDVVCYSTEGHYITDKDSGAPVIHQGRLVAVTIGGIECDGERVAIGMKINCYCSWITDNLPIESSHESCCKNCCDIKHEDSDKTYKLKTKYI